MKQVITIDDFFQYGNYFLGDCFYLKLIINNIEKEFSFIKGMLEYTPRKYQHPFYNVKINKTATYIIRDFLSGKLYIGSSSKVYERVSRHKELIRSNRHSNSKFQELLKNTSIGNFELVIIFTDTREDAYTLEQYFIDKYKNSGLLLNIANDVRFAMLGRSLTEEHRKKISKSNTGKNLSEGIRKKISISRRSSEKAITQIKEMLDRKKCPISINGVRYESFTEANKITNLSFTSIRKLLKDKLNTYWLSDNRSPLNERPISERHRNNISVGRKNSLKAQQQLNSIRELTQRKIILNGVLFKSIREAARKTGISESVIHRWLRINSGKNGNGPYILDYVKKRR